MKEIGIILGSDSDLPKIQDCFSILSEFNISFDIMIASAHRSPSLAIQWAQNALTNGYRIIIAAAGGAAHLPGVVASHTTLPVIGIPIPSDIGGGIDSLLSISQMPGGVPVATMAVGKSGATNAALFAIEILSLINPHYQTKLQSYRESINKGIIEKNELINSIGYTEYIFRMRK